MNIILLLSVCTVDIESALRRADAATEEDGERGEKEEKEEEERDLRSSNKRGGKSRSAINWMRPKYSSGNQNRESPAA